MTTHDEKTPLAAPALQGLRIRPAELKDAHAVRDVVQRAFGRPHEADLVEQLCAAGAVTLALVAIVRDERDCEEVAGHVLFSPVTIDRTRELSGAVARPTASAVGLAPLSVRPERQRAGIGAALVHAGLAALRAAGAQAVVVLGWPAYYPRFGFVPAARFGLRWEHPCSEGSFMALELQPGALSSPDLAGVTGVVRYHPAVGRL